MAIFDIFSKRQRKLRGEVPDVYTYDKLPNQLRVQLVHVFRDMLGDSATFDRPAKLYAQLVELLCREHGVFSLSPNRYRNESAETELHNFFLQVEDTEQALDVVEVCARAADLMTRNTGYLYENDPNPRIDSGLEELNERLREHGIGYQYESGDIVRVDSDLLHTEAVKPALGLLRTKDFEGPREEFLKAYEHYRHSRHEEALTDALKSFESTMKVICDQKGWIYDAGATAAKLVNICLTNGLVDSFWQNEFAGLRMTLENGINTVRNKLGGHGQGSEPREVPREIVAYALHMTASTIVFLIESARRS
jgi:hypothetical protein